MSEMVIYRPTGPLFGLFKSTLPLYFTISDIVHTYYIYRVFHDRILNSEALLDQQNLQVLMSSYVPAADI